MKFRIVYNKSFDSIVSNLEQKYKIVKELVNESNILEISFENEIIYNHKLTFPRKKISYKVRARKRDF